MRAAPYTLRDFAHIIAESEGRDAAPILEQLRNVRELLQHKEASGQRVARLYPGEEICAARLVLALLDAGSEGKELKHLATYFRLGRKVNGKQLFGVPALVNAIRAGDSQPWALHAWTRRTSDNDFVFSGAVKPLNDVFNDIKESNDPTLISHLIIAASALIEPLLRRIDAEVD